MIANNFHFIYIFGETTYPFALSHYLSIKSNILVNKPDKVYVYTNDIKRLKSYSYFYKILNEFDNIEVIDIADLGVDIANYLGRDIKHITHQADILRNIIITKFSGVYSDFDSIAVNPLPKDWFNSDKSIFCTEDIAGNPTAICIGFYLGVKDCPLQLANLANYATYDSNTCMPGTPTWSKYGVQAMWDIYNKHKDWVTLVPAKLFEPLYLDYVSVRDLFYLDKTEKIKDSYQLHLWETRNGLILRTMDEETINTIESTYTLIARKYL